MKEVLNLNLNSRLKEVRLNLGLSQEYFGKKIGLTRSAVSKLETNSRGVTKQTIKTISREFNVNENWLKTGEGNMFIELSKSELAANVVGRLLSEDDEFVQSVFIALGQMSKDEWAVIKKLVDKIKDND